MTECGRTHWARWVWEDTGPGRYHAIADVGVGLGVGQSDSGLTIVTFRMMLNTACGRVREEPGEGPVHDPPREQCCPECLRLDDLRDRFEGNPDVAPVDSPPELVPA